MASLIQGRAVPPTSGSVTGSLNRAARGHRPKRDRDLQPRSPEDLQPILDAFSDAIAGCNGPLRTRGPIETRSGRRDASHAVSCRSRLDRRRAALQVFHVGQGSVATCTHPFSTPLRHSAVTMSGQRPWDRDVDAPATVPIQVDCAHEVVDTSELMAGSGGMVHEVGHCADCDQIVRRDSPTGAWARAEQQEDSTGHCGIGVWEPPGRRGPVP